MRVVVVGRCAIGTLYCKAFARCEGVEVKVAVDQERLKRYREEKLTFNGELAGKDSIISCFSSGFTMTNCLKER